MNEDVNLTASQLEDCSPALRAQDKMIRCKGCRGHGYYIVPADVGGTRSDRKKICGDCNGTGSKLHKPRGLSASEGSTKPRYENGDQ